MPFTVIHQLTDSILLRIRADGTCDCGQVNHHARQSVLGTSARQRVVVRPIRRNYAIKVLPALAEDRAARCTVRAACHPTRRAPRTSCTARTRTLRPDCRAPRIPHTPHVNPSRLASPLPSWRGRQSDDPAARRWAVGGASCGGGAQGPSPPPCATFLYVQALASKVSLPISAYRHPPPEPCAATAAYAQVQARSR